MENLKEAIRKSPYRTQERFSAASGICEAAVSRYCRGIREPSENHKRIIEEILNANENAKRNN
jgi:transcriptional regulator with XRE-family HTH domain